MNKITQDEINAALYLIPKLTEQTSRNMLSELASKDVSILLDDKLFKMPSVSSWNIKLNINISSSDNTFPPNIPEDKILKALLRVTDDTVVKFIVCGVLGEEYHYAAIKSLVPDSETLPNTHAHNLMTMTDFQNKLSRDALLYLQHTNPKFLIPQSMLENPNISLKDFEAYIKFIRNPQTNIVRKFRYYRCPAAKMEPKHIIEKILSLGTDALAYPGITLILYRAQYVYPELFSGELKDMLRFQGMRISLSEFEACLKKDSDWQHAQRQRFYNCILGQAILHGDKKFLNSELMPIANMPPIEHFFTIGEHEYQNFKNTTLYMKILKQINLFTDKWGPLIVPLNYTIYGLKLIKDAIGDKLIKLHFLFETNSHKLPFIRDILLLQIHISRESNIFDSFDDGMFKECDDVKDYMNNEKLLVNLLCDFGHDKMIGIDWDKFKIPSAKQRIKKYFIERMI